MRWIALAIILMSLPAFIALIGRNKARRDWAILALGLLMFLVGPLAPSAAIDSWRMWPGISKGIIISPIDTLSIALIVTRNSRFNRMPFVALLSLYWIPTAVSIGLSSLPMASTFVLIEIIQMVVMAIAITGELHRPSALPKLLQGLSLGLMFQAGYVVQQKLSGVVQAPGTTPHQNILGLMVELSLIPLIAAVLEGHRSKIVYGGILAGLLVVAGGGSRATLSFLALGIVMLLILSLVRKVTPHKTKIVGFAVLLAMITVPLAMATLRERFGDRSVVTGEGERVAFARAARMIAHDHPFGVGANMYVTVSNTQGYSTRAGVGWFQGNRAAPAHDAYLMTRAENGWWGEFALIALILTPIIYGFRMGFRKRKVLINGVALGSACAVTVNAFHNNYEYAFTTAMVQRLFWINFAIVAVCVLNERASRRKKRKKPERVTEAHKEPVAAS